MNIETTASNKFSVFVLGAFLNIIFLVDYLTLADYVIKAAFGGVIWLAAKLAGEILTAKLRAYLKEKEKEGTGNGQQ